MMLFDTHCHLDDEKYADDLEQVLERMMQAGVVVCTSVGYDIASSRRCLALANKYPFIYAAVGVHPHDAKDAQPGYLNELDLMLRETKCVALGEIGLDYYYDHSPRDVQKRVLEEQMALAFRRDMPVVYHVRDAHGDMLEILHKHEGRLPRGVIHCCSASAEMVQEYLKLGLYISFAGPVTFKNAAGLLEAAKVVPPNRLMIETDSPYMAPVPLRGQRNEPANVYYVMQAFSKLHGIPEDVVSEITFENGLNFFNIPTPDYAYHEGIFPFKAPEI